MQKASERISTMKRQKYMKTAGTYNAEIDLKKLKTLNYYTPSATKKRKSTMQEKTIITIT